MAKNSCLTLIVILASLFCFLGSITSEAQETARNRKKGVDILKYYGVSDPKRAADELEKVAIENGSDLDYVQPTQLNIYKGYEPFRISTARRTFIPVQVADDEFRSELTKLGQQGKEDSALVCILQTNRHLSLRETISLFKSGITFYEDISDYATIVKIPVGVAQGLLNAPFLGWIGEFKSTDKYTLPDQFASDEGCYVESFEGDKPEFRSDLKNLGIGAINYFPAIQTYMVPAGRSKYSDIAALWWVRKISTLAKPGTLNKTGNARLETELTTDVNFKAQDSRTLINSWMSSYNGSSVLVGIFDDGFKSSYFNAHYASLAATECYHGTHVAGILAGHSVSGQYGNIYQGVAQASTILYMGYVGDWTRNEFSSLALFEQYCARTANFSTYDDVYAPFRYRYYRGSNTLDETIDRYADKHDMVLLIPA
jgi:subtilisin family serine protease